MFYYLMNKKQVLGHEITIGALIYDRSAGLSYSNQNCIFFKFNETFKFWSYNRTFKKVLRPLERVFWRVRDCFPTFISRVQYSCDDPRWSCWGLEFYWCGHLADWSSHGDGPDSINRVSLLRGLELTLKGQTSRRSDED